MNISSFASSIGAFIYFSLVVAGYWLVVRYRSESPEQSVETGSRVATQKTEHAAAAKESAGAPDLHAPHGRRFGF